MKKLHKNISAGFSIIEVIVAMSLIVIIVVTGVTTVLHSFSVNRLTADEITATFIAQEGLEASRSIKNQSWSNLVTGTYGLDNTSGSWVFDATPDALDGFSREIIIDSVYRDGAGSVVTSGGTIDTDTVKVTSKATWDFSPTRTNAVSLITYLTNWAATINSGDWSTLVLTSSIDFSGRQNGKKVDTNNNYAYVVRAGGTPDFIVVNISNPESPVITGSLSLSGTPSNVSYNDGYAFVSSSDGNELQVISVSNPAHPSMVGTFNASGGANGNDVAISGSYAYLVRNSSYRDEFYVISIDDPTNPRLTKSLNLKTKANEVVILGSYAYVATDSNKEELMIIDISNPKKPTKVGRFNASGRDNAQSITGHGSMLFLGRKDGEVIILDVSEPTEPLLVSVYKASGSVHDLDLNTSRSLLFIATDNAAGELEVVDVSVPGNPTLLGTFDANGESTSEEGTLTGGFDTSGKSALNGVSYNEVGNNVVAVGDNNSAELLIISPK